MGRNISAKKLGAVPVIPADKIAKQFSTSIFIKRFGLISEEYVIVKSYISKPPPILDISTACVLRNFESIILAF